MAKKVALITGINGFVGSHLAEYLINKRLSEVHGIIRNKHSNLENIGHILGRVKLHECDITDYFSLQKTLDKVQPDYIFHLAAQPFVPTSWQAPVQTFNENTMASLNLFEALRKCKSDPRVQIAGSSEEYGLVLPNEVPIKETNPLRPLSPYGVSKVAMDLLGWQYFKSYGLKIVRTRAFNHTGPRRGQQYALSNWCWQISQIEIGKQKPYITVGNLTAKRDFTDVRDIVRAYWLAAKIGKTGEDYNICSGRPYVMGDLVKTLQKKACKKFETKFDPAKARPSDVMILHGDCTKFRKLTGWKPKIKLEQTLDDLLNYWREKSLFT